MLGAKNRSSHVRDAEVTNAGLDFLLDPDAKGEYCDGCGGPCTGGFWAWRGARFVVVAVGLLLGAGVALVVLHLLGGDDGAPAAPVTAPSPTRIVDAPAPTPIEKTCVDFENAYVAVETTGVSVASAEGLDEAADMITGLVTSAPAEVVGPLNEVAQSLTDAAEKAAQKEGKGLGDKTTAAVQDAVLALRTACMPMTP